MSKWASERAHVYDDGEEDEEGASELLKREEFGRSMASLFWRESQAATGAPGELSLRLSRRLLLALGLTCYVDFFAARRQGRQAGWRASLSRARWLPARGQHSRAALVLAEAMKYFYIYYALVKISLVLSLQWNYDMKWHRLKELLGHCASSADQLARLEFPLDAGLLLINGDPTRNSLLLYSSLEPNASWPRPPPLFGPNLFVCRPAARADEHTASGRAAANETTNQQVAAQQLELKQARQLIKLIGNSYLNHNFPFECTLLFMLVFTLVTYFTPLVLQAYDITLDFGLLRAMLGLRRELEASFELVRDQVNSFIKSSGHFATIGRSQMAAAWQLHAGQASQALPAHLLEHRHSVRLAKQLALSGALQPANRLQRRLVFSASLFSATSIMLTSGATLLGLFVAQALPRIELLSSLPQYRIELEARDVLFLIEMTLYFTISPHIPMFYITYAAVNCVDQLIYSADLRLKFLNCRLKLTQMSQQTREQSRKHSHHDNAPSPSASRQAELPHRKHEQGPHRPRSKRQARGVKRAILCELHKTEPTSNHQAQLDSDRELIERQMLELVLRYKIFVKQFQPIRRSLSLLSLGALVVLVVPPLTANFYYVYLDAGCRNLIAAFSVLFSIAADILFLPICRLNCSCQDIYRELCKLLARSVQLASLDKAGSLTNRCLLYDTNSSPERQTLGCYVEPTRVELDTNQSVYDNHIQWLLRKELGHPELLLNNFAVSVGGMQICYENLIKIHFWLGFVLLPTVLLDSNSMGRRSLFSVLA